MSILKRGGGYQLRKWVPKRYQGVDHRGEVWISLHTDSPSIAQQKADGVWTNQIEAWETRLAAAQELARVQGFRYLPAAKVAALPLQEVVERLEASDIGMGQFRRAHRRQDPVGHIR